VDADEEVGEEDDDEGKVGVGVVDVAAGAVVSEDPIGKIWAFILTEKRRRTRTKVFIKGVGREGARQQNQFCH
jgi:hypothetical protein